MRTFASVLFLCLFFKASAQRECATQAYNKTVVKKSSSPATQANTAASSIKLSKNFISGITGISTGSATSTVIRIPVVVHVLYNTAAQNISDAQIKSGIAALNRDFRRQNSDTVNTPERFKAVAADVEIEFSLATATPAGAATTGIVRKQTSVPAFDMDDKIKFSAKGGDDAWDSKRYLNIWIGNTRRLLGYATMPGGDETVDGVVINLTAFGTINTAAPYELGRTAVHETGHWLGLQHLWGDQACGDDEVDDTPKQSGYTSGCPSGIRTSCGNNATGDMYMNYMDFTNDACMNLFTLGQKAKMRALFHEGGLRQSLLSSTGLNEPWTEEVSLVKEETVIQAAALKIYPNPAIEEMTLQFETDENAATGELYLLNANGFQVQKLMITSHSQKLSLQGLKPGVYFLHGVVNSTRINQKLVKL